MTYYNRYVTHKGLPVFLAVVLLLASAWLFLANKAKLPTITNPQKISAAETVTWCEGRSDSDYVVVKAWLKDFIQKNRSESAERVVFLAQNNGTVKVFYKRQDENWYKFYISKDNTDKKAWKSVKALIDEVVDS